MATTPLGFVYADDDDPVDVPLSIRELAESVDAYLTPQIVSLPLVSPFEGGLNVTRVGPIVVLTGGLRRTGWSSTSSVQVATIPAGMAPPIQAATVIGSTRNNGGTYQLSANPDGRIMYQLTVVDGFTAGINLVWGVG